MDPPVHACLIVDDTPANGSYWQRAQQNAMGFATSDTGWAENWRDMATAAWFRAEDARAFADFVEEFGVRGKFTVLPCPAGLGRIDRSVRGYPDAELKGFLSVVRERIAGRFDITPEVLTHSMAYDPETEGLLPHCETAWVTHLCASRQREKLEAYLRHGCRILPNVGLEPRGLTTGGMEDLSGIGAGKSVLHGHYREVLGEAWLAVLQEFSPAMQTTFLYTGSPPVSESSRSTRMPESVYRSPEGGTVFEIHSIVDDPAYPVLRGRVDRVESATDALVSADLERGLWIDEAEAGRALVFTVHAQTLNAMNTGAGLRIVREAVRRLRERYGSRLVWKTAMELCAERAG